MIESIVTNCCGLISVINRNMIVIVGYCIGNPSQLMKFIYSVIHLQVFDITASRCSRVK